jgi:hypothetical protein
MEISNKRIAICLSCALLTGFFIGGLVWGSSVETKTLFEAYEVEKEVIVERAVETIKVVEVVKKEYVTADKAIVKETKQPDGTILIESEYYNLGVSKQASEVSKETSKDVYSEESKEVVKSEKSLTTSTLSNSLSLSFYSPYSNLLSFNYQTDWTLTYNRHIMSSPFFGSISLGPKQFSLGIGFSF